MSARSWMTKLGAPLLTLLLTLCFAGVAQAAKTYTVNSTADTDATGDQAACTNGQAGCTLRAAIDVANTDGDASTINVQPGRYDRNADSNEYEVANDQPLTINGTSGNPKDQVISADGMGRVFEQDANSNLTFSNVTVQDGFTGNGQCNGAGILVDAGESDGTTNLTVNNSVVTKNVEVCTDNGGGINAGPNTSVTLNGSHVDNNNTDGRGGGIYYDGDLTLANTTVDGNTASEAGGGIADAGTSLNATGSDISGNVSTGGSGGGIYHGVVESSDVNLTDTHVDNNVADDGDGGGIYSDVGALSLTRVTVNANRGWGSAGGVYQDGSGLTATDTQIDSNWADAGGGGVYTESGLASFTRGSVAGNRAQGEFSFLGDSGEGGGIYNDGSDNNGDGLKIDGTDLSNNVAQLGSGGGVSNEDGNLTVSNATLNNNTAGSEIFCIYIYCGTNSADGGAIYNDGGNATVTGSQLNDNVAETQGGGIYNDTGDLAVSTTTLDRNQAKTNGESPLCGGCRNGGGGGVFNSQYAGNVTLTDAHVDDNKATDAPGGGIYNCGLDLILLRATVDGNFAYGNGGGIDNEGTADSIVDSSVSKNIADRNGGGLYEDASASLVVFGKVKTSSDSIVGSTIQNSTFANNQADAENNSYDGGGIYDENVSGMNLINVTLAGNLANSGNGGGIYSDDETVNLKNTIVADNQANGTTGTNNCDSGSATFNSQGNNIDGKDECSLDGTGANGDQINTDPKLGPLQDNGGDTLTRALSDGSPAIDKGDEAICHDPVGDHDQRQAPRPIGASCDVGAYEAYALADLSISKDASPSPVGTDSDLTYTLHVANNGPDKMLSVSVSDPVPSGTTFKSVNTDHGSCDNTVSCNLGALAPGDTATITIVVHTGSSAGTVTNTATVAANATNSATSSPTRNASVTPVAPKDPDTSNNSATVQTQVNAPNQPTKSQPGPTIQAGPQACLKTPPRTSISRNGLQAAANTLRFVGRSIDLRCLTGKSLGIKKVQIAVALKVGSKCRFLAKNGTLGKARSCRKPKYLTARRGKVRNGKVPWTFRIRNLNLPAGTYIVTARGTDTNNDVEKKIRTYNRKTFTIH